MEKYLNFWASWEKYLVWKLKEIFILNIIHGKFVFLHFVSYSTEPLPVRSHQASYTCHNLRRCSDDVPHIVGVRRSNTQWTNQRSVVSGVWVSTNEMPAMWGWFSGINTSSSVGSSCHHYCWQLQLYKVVRTKREIIYNSFNHLTIIYFQGLEKDY